MKKSHPTYGTDSSCKEISLKTKPRIAEDIPSANNLIYESRSPKPPVIIL